jgi:hypothetical protein
MPLVCQLETLSQGQSQCTKFIGGLRATYAVDWLDVDTAVVTAGVLSALTLKATKNLVKIEGDDDNSSFYNQEGAREGNAYRNTQSAFIKFTGLTNAKVVAANHSKGVLKGLYIHLLNDGSLHVQGGEFNADASALIPSFQGAKLNPSAKSNTGEGESALEYNIQSVSGDLVPTSMTVSALEALLAA